MRDSGFQRKYPEKAEGIQILAKKLINDLTDKIDAVSLFT